MATWEQVEGHRGMEEIRKQKGPIPIAPTPRASFVPILSQTAGEMQKRGTYLGKSRLEFTPLLTATGEEMQTAEGETLMVEILTDWRK